MYKIAVCDDEQDTCMQVEECILEDGKEREEAYETEVFLDGNSLKKYLEAGNQMDILFLDIELPRLNGIEVGAFIRNCMQNEGLYLVYISSKENYAMQLFKNRPFDFLVKPITKEAVADVMDRILKLDKKMKNYFEFQQDRTYHKLLYRDIIYFQSRGNKIYIMTVEGETFFYGKLNQVEEEVPSDMFLRIHKSYLVNREQIMEFRTEEVKMLNGERLAISKVNRAKVRRLLME